MFENIFFWIYAIIALLSAIFVIGQRKAIYSALSLIIFLCSFAGLFSLLGATFVAAIQVIVYAGAIMILFIFIIWFLGIKAKDEPKIEMKWIYTAIIFCIIVGVEIVINYLKYFKAERAAKTYEIKEIAKVLLTKYVLAFELTSILFLAALIGTFYLAKNKKG